jgi:hypothetical protein
MVVMAIVGAVTAVSHPVVSFCVFTTSFSDYRHHLHCDRRYSLLQMLQLRQTYRELEAVEGHWQSVLNMLLYLAFSFKYHYVSGKWVV